MRQAIQPMPGTAPIPADKNLLPSAKADGNVMPVRIN